MIDPSRVVAAYSDQLRFPEQNVRHRRDLLKYITLIKTIAFLHQYQREVKTIERNGQSLQVIEVTRRDIDLAGTIALWALRPSLDELAVPTRRLLEQLQDYVSDQSVQQSITASQVRFTRRAVREALNWQATQLAFHLEVLCKSEYVVSHGRGQGKLYQYSSLSDETDHTPALGLVTADMLHEPPTSQLLGS